MCWNEDISINTFVFACLTLVFIFFTNTYTKYKTHTFDNPLMYLFILAVSAMQLIEYFLWRNLKNAHINRFFSTIAACIILLQQFILILVIPNSTVKYGMLVAYLLVLFIHVVYRQIYGPFHFYTSVAENGHLSWEWMNYSGYGQIWFAIFLLFYILPILAINDSALLAISIGSLVISSIYYFKYNVFGTIWCWSINLFLLYFIVDILFIKPYYEYNV